MTGPERVTHWVLAELRRQVQLPGVPDLGRALEHELESIYRAGVHEIRKSLADPLSLARDLAHGDPVAKARALLKRVF